jgi:GNAT superfamily N-acetyltransferase
MRWVRTNADPVVADLAITVIDDYQGRGLGGLLLDVAVLDGRAQGIDRFEGLVLGENISSRRMLARGGATLRPDGAGVLAYRLPLRPRIEVLRDSALPALVAAQSRRAGIPLGGLAAARRVAP